MTRSLMRYGFATAAAIAIFVTVVDVSFGATGSKVCDATGVTTAVGIKTFGAGARASEGFDGWGWCQIDYGGANQEVVIYLSPKSQLQTVLQGANVAYDPHVALKGLGPKAVAVVHNHFITVVFTAGAYTAEIKDNGDGAAPFPTVKEYEALALVVHAHLAKAPTNLCSQTMCAE